VWLLFGFGFGWLVFQGGLANDNNKEAETLKSVIFAWVTNTTLKQGKNDGFLEAL
jgi:hypothetical protein